MKKVVIFGAGGFGREVAEIFKGQNKIKPQWDILGFIDDSPSLKGEIINNFPVLGGIEWLIANGDGIGCVVAIGDPKGKRQVVERLEAIGSTFVNAIHPSVIMSETVEMGTDVILCAGNILTVNISIGDHIIVNLNSTIGHDVVINDYCSIMPNVTISGNDKIGKGVYIGTGAILIENISVGEWTTIGAGSVIIRDIIKNVVAVGVPAKVVRHLSEE